MSKFNIFSLDKQRMTKNIEFKFKNIQYKYKI